MLDGLKRLRLVWLLLAAFAPPCAAADTNPHIVLQAADSSVDAAAWTPDDRYLVVASGVEHVVTIWDMANRRVVDHIALPVDGSKWSGDFLRIESIEVMPDGMTAMVRGVVLDVAKQSAPSSRDFLIGLRTREAIVLPPRALPAGTKGLETYLERVTALTVLYQNDRRMSAAAAAALLPRLPSSHDGRWSLERTDTGMHVSSVKESFTLTGPERMAIDDAALSPDGRILAIIGGKEEGVAESNVYVGNLLRFNVATGLFLPPLKLTGDYGFIRWLDDDRLLVTSSATDEDRDSPEDEDARQPISPALVIDARSGATLESYEGRCYIQPLLTGYIAAAPANCRTGLTPSGVISITTPRWTKLVDLTGYKVDAIATSADGKLAAITGADAKGVSEIAVIDATTGKLVDTFSWPKGIEGIITNAQFAADGRNMIIAANGGAQIWEFGKGNGRIIQAKTTAPQMIASDGRDVLLSAITDDTIARATMADGKPLPPIEFAHAIAGGFLKDRPIFWAASALEGLRMWDTRDWHVLMTSVPLTGNHFVTVMPDGRYDTDLGPDADAFRWIVPDAPFQSLPAQTFMRDYFTPRLAEKVLDCTAAGTCASILPALPSLTTLNRVLPEVRIVTVEPTKPGVATVYVAVKEGINTAAANGRTRSGVYNVRLFRNGRLVDNAPDDRDEVAHQTLAAWRKSNAWSGVADVSGVFGMQFEVPLPTGPGADKQVFTAYAFNEDRVKSETARYAYSAPPAPPRPRRAYIVTIGIDAYDDPRLKLNFSAADAKLMGERLSTIPGYEVHHFDLTSATLPDGRVRKVTSDVIRAAFLQLTGAGDIPGMGDLLKDFDTTGITQVTPDDLVIVTWSGHGWANRQGDFFLVPADAKWPAGAEPDQSSLISAADLTMFLRAVRGGEMAFIIDACHSAASVDTADFKPGPMGDAGLGQLAYDKGMRILAATQASDVAIEDARVGQGLLTYALAGEGVTPAGGKADLNKDGRITLDEWLRYAVQRLPSLSADVKLGKLASARDFDDVAPVREAKPQEPALFDFTGKPSPVVLRVGVK